MDQEGEDMQSGILSSFFESAGAKYLSEVEVNRFFSNQHEFQGVSEFRNLLGTPAERVEFPATFYWLDDDEDAEPAFLEASCTWYDARLNQPDRSPEYRLYYPAAADPIVQRAVAGDLLVIAKTPEQKLLIILCPVNTTVEQQLLWLFGLNPRDNKVDVKPFQPDSTRLGFAARSLLDDIGIGLVEPEPSAFEELISLYGNNFPKTSEFSKFARDTLPGINSLESPDEALIAWMDHEEALFRHLERHIVDTRLKAGFVKNGAVDVDGFTEFSLSVHNRRKSRAGWALGHHLEIILKDHGIRYAREAFTEGRKKPDFLFPGQTEYGNIGYDATLLTMLGAKRTCKDRWRQVLTEADRIENKHLLTLEPAISASQTDEMQSAKLQLIVPRSLFTSYHQAQQDWLMDVAGFIGLVRERQVDIEQ